MRVRVLRSGWMSALAAGLSGSLLAQTAEPLTASETESLLNQIAARNGGQGTVVRFVETRHLPLLADPVVTRGILEFLPPDRFRKTVAPPNPSETVSDGKMLWIYFPEEKEAEAYDLGRHRFLRDSLAAVAAGLDPTQLARRFEIKAFRLPHGLRLELEPRDHRLRRQITSMTVELDRSGVVREVDFSEPGGGRTHLAFEGEKPARLTPEDFVFHAPPGTRVSRPLR